MSAYLCVSVYAYIFDLPVFVYTYMFHFSCSVVDLNASACHMPLGWLLLKVTLCLVFVLDKSCHVRYVQNISNIAYDVNFCASEKEVSFDLDPHKSYM